MYAARSEGNEAKMKRFLLFIGIMIIFQSPSFAGDFAIEVYQQKSKAVVFIVGRSEGKAPMVGAGSIISSSGIIVTNAHVVIDKSISRPFPNIKVYLKPDKVTGSQKKDLVTPYEASVKAFDIDLDIAIIKVENLPTDTGVMELAAPEEVKIGEEVIAIGHPEQGGFWTLTYGRISGIISNQKGIEGKDVYQTDTSVNRGNSGGPLLDKRGYMVGINTNIARLGAGNLPITGVNFALQSIVVKKWLGEQDIMLAYGTKPLYNDTRPVAVKRKGDTILTAKRPYKIDDLFKQVESDMEDMMEEMRGKIR